MEPLQSPQARSWNFPEPFGPQDVLEVPLTETVLIARHLPVREVRNFINATPLRDLEDSATPGPVAVDERGRSNQHFLVEVTARNGNEEQRISAAGRDIYAVTAPIVAEVLERVCAVGQSRAGAFALAQLVDARDVLETLAGSGEIALASHARR
jgi:hypothetical protein